jgi:hypothetical protein
MTTLSPPPQTRTIGTALVGGKPVAVQADIAWFRYWVQGLYDRAGGAIALSNTELAALITALDATVAALTEGHAIEDEGSVLTQRAVLNFTGSGVTVSDIGGKTVVDIGAGGGATWTEVEVDFGSAPVYGAEFTITDAAITAASKVQVLPCGKAATGRTADDWAWDGAAFAANPGTGSATCYAQFLPGPVVGLRRVQYSVGA